ncbi:hypothetical protein DL89DRAFT_280930 [Linderina pennispora]|uniref:Uncharacterized protein n=1 Tax=Linderina pennispora TaxID=61395 RepID=A0A1Y1WLV9_9FUNG|nr:uncharacterized protein DL89DRAFT_280930 [Linderina pennispora]ORX74549.1 hypothetical protein DL89DRAFT_280930 [Linderina pennispora]
MTSPAGGSPATSRSKGHLRWLHRPKSKDAETPVTAMHAQAANKASGRVAMKLAERAVTITRRISFGKSRALTEAALALPPTAVRTPVIGKAAPGECSREPLPAPAPGAAVLANPVDAETRARAHRQSTVSSRRSDSSAGMSDTDSGAGQSSKSWRRLWQIFPDAPCSPSIADFACTLDHAGVRWYGRLFVTDQYLYFGGTWAVAGPRQLRVWRAVAPIDHVAPIKRWQRDVHQLGGGILAPPDAIEPALHPAVVSNISAWEDATINNPETITSPTKVRASHRPWHRSAIRLPLSDITRVSKELTMGLWPNALTVAVGCRHYIFTNLIRRDKAYQRIFDAWMSVQLCSDDSETRSTYIFIPNLNESSADMVTSQVPARRNASLDVNRGRPKLHRQRPRRATDVKDPVMLERIDSKMDMAVRTVSFLEETEDIPHAAFAGESPKRSRQPKAPEISNPRPPSPLGILSPDASPPVSERRRRRVASDATVVGDVSQPMRVPNIDTSPTIPEDASSSTSDITPVDEPAESAEKLSTERLRELLIQLFESVPPRDEFSDSGCRLVHEPPRQPA